MEKRLGHGDSLVTCEPSVCGAESRAGGTWRGGDRRPLCGGECCPGQRSKKRVSGICANGSQILILQIFNFE